MKTQLIQSLDWEVKTQPVLYNSNGQIIEDCDYMHISKSNGQPLSVMSKKYVPLTIEDFSKNVEILQDVSGYSLEGFQEFKDGRVILGILKSSEESNQAKIPSLNYVVVGSSFDGSRPFFIGNSTLLIRCQNAFSQITMFDTVKHTKSSPLKIEGVQRAFAAKHTKSSPLKIEGVQRAFAAYLQDQKSLSDNLEKMDLMKISETDKVEYARMVLNILPNREISTITQNRLDDLMVSINKETSDVGNTVFGMFQGVTHYTTHSITQKEEVFGNIFGTKDMYNQRAYRQALHLVA